MKKKVKIEIVIALAGALGLILFLNFSLGIEPFLIQQHDLPELELDIPMTDFTLFAVAIIFLYDMLPTVAQQFSISAITVQLLMTGFSPVILGILSATALLAGQMVLYVVGMFARHIHKGGFGDIAGNHHFLHKYHFLIYFMIPFVGIMGDGAMLYSGHQRINPLKMIPFLWVADFASTMRWIVPTVAELEISNHLQGS